MLKCSAVCCSVLQSVRDSAQHRVFYHVVVWCGLVQLGAVWCSVSQCVAVCRRVLQWVAVDCSGVQWVAVFALYYSVLQCAVVSCSGLQCVAECLVSSTTTCVDSAVVCCSVLWCVAVCCSGLQRVALRCRACGIQHKTSCLTIAVCCSV